MEKINVSNLTIGKNPRSTKRSASEMDQLARSIAQRGIMAPVEVARKNGETILVDGFGRIEALKLAQEKYSDIAAENGVDLTVVPYHSMGNASEQDMVIEPILRNNFRTNMNEVDTAKQVQRCIDAGHDVAELEALFGERKFKEYVKINELDPSIQTLIAKGELKPSVAFKYVNNYGEKAAAKLEKLSVKLKGLLETGQRKNARITEKVDNEAKETTMKTVRLLIEKFRGNDQFSAAFQTLLRLKNGENAESIFSAVEAGDDFIEVVKEPKAPKVKSGRGPGRPKKVVVDVAPVVEGSETETPEEAQA